MICRACAGGRIIGLDYSRNARESDDRGAMVVPYIENDCGYQFIKNKIRNIFQSSWSTLWTLGGTPCYLDEERIHVSNFQTVELETATRN